MKWSVWTTAAAVWLAVGTSAVACTLPVYRYALEKWQRDRYRIDVFHRGPLKEADVERLKALVDRSVAVLGDVPAAIEAGPAQPAGVGQTANISLRFVNVSKELPAPVRALWRAQKKATLPWVVVRYPRAARMVHPVYAGPLGKFDGETFVDSPARQRAAERILEGDAVVWMLLECGDEKKNEAAAAVVEQTLAADQEERRLAAGEVEEGEVPPATFALVRVDRGDAREVPFATTLIKSHPHVMRHLREPIVFALFAKCRVYTALAGDGIEPESIRAANEFLTSPCACVIKEENPGIDLVVQADWTRMVSLGIEEDAPVPTLTSPAARIQESETARNQATDAFPAEVAPVVAATATGSGSLVRNAMLTVAGALALVGAATAMLLKRRGDLA